VTLPAPDSDRDKAARIVRAVPQDAPWLKALASGAPLRRIPFWLTKDTYAALNQLRGDVVDFLDPELVTAHQGFVDALARLDAEFDGTFSPNSDDCDYTEVPPEWKQTQRDRYYKTLSDLDTARKGVLTSYKELMNTMNSKGKLPPETPENGAPAPVRIRTGDHSPVTYYAPQAHASHGGTANANVTTKQPAAPVDADYPKSFWRDPKTVGIGTALIVLIALVTLYFTVYPNH
jgi:hypothetical protein